MSRAVPRRARLVGALLALALAVPAAAQTPYSDLPQAFKLDVGGFRIASETTLKYDLGGAGQEVDFEREAALPSNATTIWLDGTWRAGRRHQLSLNYTTSSRKGDRALDREIHWGDQVFPVGVQVESEMSTDILTGYYRFALYKNDRFEVGPTLGVGYLWLSAGLHATVSEGGVSVPLGKTAETGSITGDVGGYFEGWLTRRLVARGDLLYIIVKPDGSEASVTDGRLGLYYYFSRHIGIGAQYKYYKYRYDRVAGAAELGGSIRFQGGQVFASFLF